jgi:hypothetical protein
MMHFELSVDDPEAAVKSLYLTQEGGSRCTSRQFAIWTAHGSCSTQRGTRSACVGSDLLPAGVEVEAESDECDRTIGSKLASDGDPRDEESCGDDDG